MKRSAFYAAVLILLGFIAGSIVGPRYVLHVGKGFYRLDRWTGKVWTTTEGIRGKDGEDHYHWNLMAERPLPMAE